MGEHGNFAVQKEVGEVSIRIVLKLQLIAHASPYVEYDAAGDVDARLLVPTVHVVLIQKRRQLGGNATQLLRHVSTGVRLGCIYDKAV